MDLTLWQWILGAAAALLVGISKTGVPGAGILVVTMLADIFGGRLSAGVMLPMLIFGDIFAVAWYRRHAQWDKLVKLVPWVAVGMAIAALTLWKTGNTKGHKDVINFIIAVLVLLMLALHVLRNRLGEKLTPKSKFGVITTGTSAGFATTVSNAAGPIMQIYMAAQQMPKEQFMGTIAWYFLIINTSKLPIFAGMSIHNPKNPMMTKQTLLFNLCTLPVILAGVFIGKWLFPRISQKAFDFVVLILAGAAAVKMIVEYWM